MREARDGSGLRGQSVCRATGTRSTPGLGALPSTTVSHDELEKGGGWGRAQLGHGDRASREASETAGSRQREVRATRVTPRRTARLTSSPYYDYNRIKTRLLCEEFASRCSQGTMPSGAQFKAI
jgi:hypothetical protein